MKVHFIGIGGIGVSALAQYYLAQGWRISGSDAMRSEITDDLKKRGVRIFIGQRAQNIKNPDLVVYSAAIRPDNPELSAGVSAGIKTLTYAQAVGELTKKYYTIAVAGSHGKSTTTALIGLILVKAGLDPTIIIGTKLKELGPTSPRLRGTSNNFRLGQSKYLVLEADEYARSFHNYFPKIAVLTNIDKEHLDVYKNLNGVLAGFEKFFGNISSDGYVVANRKDKNICSIIKSEARNSKSEIPISSRILDGKTIGTNSKFQKLNPKIIWYGKGKHKLSIPGVHNQFNAEAAWQAVKLLGVKRSIADKVLRSYRGAWRRLEELKIRNLYSSKAIFSSELTRLRRLRLKQNSLKKTSLCFHIYSDYAHHPTEIKATLQALREKYPKRKLVCVFQPHQQDRLNRLFDDFIGAFGTADETVLYPLYKVKGRDPSTALRASTIGKTSADLVRAINQPTVFYADSFKEVLKLIKSDMESDSVIVFMSAGDLDDKVRRYLAL